MATTRTKIDYFNSEEGTRIRQALLTMERDISYHTNAGYSANAAAFPTHEVPFVQKHLMYLNDHQNVNADGYLSNLRLMLKVR